MSTFNIHIFRNDLRLQDNLALTECMKENTVLPIFVFTPEQIVSNRFKSDNAVQFMVSRLQDLKKELNRLGGNLYVFYGTHDDVLENIFRYFQNKPVSIGSVSYNRYVSEYSDKRDRKIENVCNRYKIKYIQATEDYSLFGASSFSLSNEHIYKKFTPFYKKYSNASIYKINTTKINKYRFAKLNSGALINIFSCKIKGSDLIVPNGRHSRKIKLYKVNNNLFVNDDRKRTINRLKRELVHYKSNYDKEKDSLFVKTTVLSPYLTFGVISVREAYKLLGSVEGIRRSLFWREFYHNIHKNFSTTQFRYTKLKWLGKDSHFKKWCEGKTGYPIVDANMRMLNKRGYMSNRGRLIVSSFLVKLLLVDWKKGEWYFATKLVDYDIANNNGNWQWIAGTGTDIQPYFRIFNPWIQSKKFDKDAIFIKHWIPELDKVEAKHIHIWDTSCNNEEYKGINYPNPIIDYKENKEKSLNMYKTA